MFSRLIGIALIMTVLLLQACTTVATSGAQAIYNHKQLQDNATDQYITMRSYQVVDIDSDQFKNTNINVSTYNRVVLLTGQVPYAWQRTEVEKKIRKIEGIKELHNLLTVENPLSQMARLQDTWITTKIKTKLMASEEDTTQVKVITEKHRVFLMGIVRPSQAKAAVNTASSTDGVESVVKVFSYLNLSKIPAEG